MSNDTNEMGESEPAAPLQTVEHSWEEPFQPSVTIVEAVAAATDRTPTELPPLQRYVDSDALDTLVTRGESAAVTVTFDYAGTTVVVKGDGTIDVGVGPARE